MANAKNVLGLLIGVTLCAAPVAKAQSPLQKIFVSVNFGKQLPTRTVSSSVSKFPIYEETATLTSTQDVNSGPVFDVGFGYDVWRNISVGVALWRFSDTETAATTARIPDPIFFNRPKTTPGSTPDLKRTEQGASLHAIYNLRLTDKLKLALSGGLSVIKVKQDLVADFTVPQGTQNVNTITATEQATGNGPYAGLDVIYSIVPHIGAGGYVRFAGAKVNLASETDANIGGMQAGAGVRLHF